MEQQQPTKLLQWLEQEDLSEQEAMTLLQNVTQNQRTNHERANSTFRAIEAIGDEYFTVQTLLDNPQAVADLEKGASVGEVYRKHFLRQPPSAHQETQANLGLTTPGDPHMSREAIERISEYVDRTGKNYTI